MYTLSSGFISLADSASTAVGSLFRTDPTAFHTSAGFGVDVEDLTFAYNEVDTGSGTITTKTGDVEYVVISSSIIWCFA